MATARQPKGTVVYVAYLDVHGMTRVWAMGSARDEASVLATAARKRDEFVQRNPSVELVIEPSVQVKQPGDMRW